MEKNYSDQFIEKLSKLTKPENIDYLVIHHMEPDHSGTIPKLSPLLGEKTIFLGHPLTQSMIRSFYGIKELNFHRVSDGEVLHMKNMSLEFIYTPWLHWPETIVTYIPEEKILLSGDIFGAYSIPEALFDKDIDEEYFSEAREYLATVIGYYRSFIIKNLEKISQKEVDLIAPAHGVIWKHPEKIVGYYRKWARGERRKGKIVIVYSSMYGFTEKAISIAVDEIKKNGIKPIIFRYTDKERPLLKEVLGELLDAEAIIIGAATYESDVYPYILFLIEEMVKKINSEKPIILLSSYGWGKVAGRKMISIFKDTKFKVLDTIEFKSMITSEDIEKIREATRRLLNQ